MCDTVYAADAGRMGREMNRTRVSNRDGNIARVRENRHLASNQKQSSVQTEKDIGSLDD